jgi:hypothetical protein
VKNLKEKTMRIAALLILGFTTMFLISPVNAAVPVISIINPITGDSNFIFPSSTPVNSTFLANITITDVTGLAGWQLNLTWDPTLIKIKTTDDIYRNDTPTHYFAIFGLFGIETIKNVKPDKVYWAVSYGIGKPTFTGSGILCQIKFTILRNDTGEPLTCSMHFDLVSSFPTKITKISGDPITFTPQDGSYVIPEFPTTTLLPLFLIITMLAFLFQKKNWLKHR